MTPQKTVLNVQSKITYSGQSGNYVFTATLANVNKEKPEQIIERKKDSRYNISMPFNYGQIYEAMEEYASQQSAALESENKELRKVLKEATAQRELRHEAWLEELSKRQEFEKVLKELVELKDMKAKLFQSKATFQERQDYHSREPLAWEAARKLVKQ